VNLNLTIDYEVTDTTPELEEALEEIVAEEARGFAETLRRRLAAEGVSDLTMNLKESRT
jgi:hypothetical protein